MAKSLFINGKTYVYGDDGKLVGAPVEGDKTRNPDYFEPRGGRLKGTPGGLAASSNIGGDLLTDVASQIPLMAIPGGGGVGKAMVKGGASLLTGLFADQAVNKLQGNDKSIGDSAADATFNTLISMGTNHLIQNPPSTKAFDRAKGWGLKGIAGGILNMLRGEPLLPEVEAATPVIRGPGGKMVSNKANYQDFINYKKKQSILDLITNGLGLGANAGIDYGVDKENNIPGNPPR